MSDEGDYFEFQVAYHGHLQERGANARKYASESQPVLHLFFTHHYTPVPSVVTETRTLNEQSAPWQGTVRVAFYEHLARSERVGPFLSRRVVSEHVRAGFVPPSCRLMINVYCRTYNDGGQECRTRAGTAHVELRQLVAMAKQNLAGSNAKRPALHLDVTQSTHDGGPLKKGDVRLDPSSVRCSSAVFLDSLLFDNDDDRICSTDENLEERRQEMIQAIERSMAVFYPWDQARWPATELYMRPIHCPEYRTPFSSVPGSCYTLRTPHSHQGPDGKTWRNWLSIVLDRLHTDAATLIRFARQQFADERRDDEQVTANFRYVCRTLAMLLTVYPNAICYLDDFSNDDANHVEITEDFKIARLTGADDCEGVAREADLEYRELLDEMADLQVTETMTVAVNDLVHLLYWLRRTAALYVRCMVEGGVTNKKLEPGVHTMTADEANAHTFFTLIPQHLFHRMCPALDEHPLRQRMLSGPRWQQSLDVLICEGTAPMDPYLRPIEDYYEESVEQQRRARQITMRRLLNMQKMMKAAPVLQESCVSRRIYQYEEQSMAFSRNERDLSMFYKSFISLYTDHFLSSEWRKMDYVFLYREQGTYGVYANDVILKADSVELVPYVEWSEREALIADDLLLQMEPIPRITYSSAEHRQCLQRMDRLLAPIVQRQFGSKISALPPLPSPHINFMVREQDLSTERVNNIAKSIDTIRTADADIKGFRVHVRYLGNTEAERFEGDAATCVVDFDFYY